MSALESKSVENKKREVPREIQDAQAAKLEKLPLQPLTSDGMLALMRGLYEDEYKWRAIEIVDREERKSAFFAKYLKKAVQKYPEDNILELYNRVSHAPRLDNIARALVMNLLVLDGNNKFERRGYMLESKIAQAGRELLEADIKNGTLPKKFHAQYEAVLAQKQADYKELMNVTEAFNEKIATVEPKISGQKPSPSTPAPITRIIKDTTL